MKTLSTRWAPLLAAALLAWGGPAVGQDAAAAADKVAALKQSLQSGMAAVRKYEWVETTTLSLKGEQKSKKQNQCYYGADGVLQKIPTGGGQAEAKSPGGIRGKIAANKKEEMADYMEAAVKLIKEYVPPDPAQVQKVKDAGKLSFTPLAADKLQLQFHDYHKAGDILSVYLDPTTNHLLGLRVSTYLEKPDDKVTLDVTMNTLSDGAVYPSAIDFDGYSKEIKVEVRNTGHRLMSQAK